MQNQARPTHQKILKLSIGLGGILHTICVPALADSGNDELALQDAATKITQSQSQQRQQVQTIDEDLAIGVSEPLLPKFSTAAIEGLTVASEPSACASDNPNNLPVNSSARLRRGLNVAKLSVQKPLSVLDSYQMGVAQAYKAEQALQDSEKQRLKNSINSESCSSQADSSSELHLEQTSQSGEANRQEPLVASLLDDAQMRAEQQGSSALTLDELIQIADSWQVTAAETATDTEGSISESALTSTQPSDKQPLSGETLDHVKDEEEEAENARSEESTVENAEDNKTENSEEADEWLQDLPDLVSEQQVVVEEGETLDNELGSLRLQQLRSRDNEELGILRLLQTAEATPPPPKPPIAFLTGRLGFFDTENAFRSQPRADEQIYQSGLTFYLFPKLSESTSLYGIAETNLARYENFDRVNYNELEVQMGIRQRLFRRTYAQIGWRNQRLYSPGYRERLFNVHYIDTLLSHRSVLNSKTWLDSFYQMRLGFADPEAASRLRQTFTLSLNYGATRNLRTSLIYQLDFDDYTQISRFDTYQQVLGIISYNLTPESRISVFGGTRFGNSSISQVNLNDTFYGAGLNVNVPLF